MHPLPGSGRTVRAAALTAVMLGVGLLIGASGAAAQTLTPTQACFVISPGQLSTTVSVNALGLTAGDDYTLTNQDASGANLPSTDLLGDSNPVAYFSDTQSAPGSYTFADTPVLSTPGPAYTTFTLGLNDVTGSNYDEAETSVNLANLAVQIGPVGRDVSPVKRTKWTASGLVGGDAVYEHAISPHHKVYTVRIGTARGPCGIMTAMARPLPTAVGQVIEGTWRLQIDGSRKYTKQTVPRVLETLSVF